MAITPSYTPNVLQPTLANGVASDAAYVKTPNDGQQWLDLSTGTWFTRARGIWWADAPGQGGNPAAITVPGAVAQSFDSGAAVVDQVAALTTAILTLVAVNLVEGQVVNNLNWLVGATAGVTMTHQWGVIATGTAAGASLVVAAVTADATSGAIPASAFLTQALATPYVAPATGLYFAGLMVAAATVPSLVCETVSAIMSEVGVLPVLVGPSSTGQTTPPAVAASLTTISAVGTKRPYVFLN